MKLIIHHKETGSIAELETGKILASVDDFLDVIGNSSYQGIGKVIVRQQNIHPDFFDLKTRLAGEVLQKFSTYRQKLAIVGDFSIYTSKSLKDFIRESNRMKQILFVSDISEALEML